MNIEKLLFLIYLMLFVCVFEELLLAILIAIAIYLGVVIIKELKDLNQKFYWQILCWRKVNGIGEVLSKAYL